jgi:putative glutamine amidotransferase
LRAISTPRAISEIAKEFFADICGLNTVLMKTSVLKLYSLAAFALFVLVFPACQTEPAPKPRLIAVSYIGGDTAGNNYLQWLRYADPQVRYVVMNQYPWDSVGIIFNGCTGLLLTGGEDVYPGYYNQIQDTGRCDGFNHYRDSLEFLLIEQALQRKLPIMGVCRGQQILNVAMGGSLVVDIPTEIQTAVYHRCIDWQNCYHQVMILPENMLTAMGARSGDSVTSNHHQAVKRTADDLKVLAVANDGVIEAVGWKYPEGKPFLLGVQWHPERMDTISPLSMPVARKFLEEAN